MRASHGVYHLRQVCAKFAAAFLEPLLGTRGASLTTLAQLRAQSARSELICFDRLLVGSAFDAFNSDALNDGKVRMRTLGCCYAGMRP